GRGGVLQRLFFFFQAEDGIRDFHVTGVQTCALPIFSPSSTSTAGSSPGCAPPATASPRTPCPAAPTGSPPGCTPTTARCGPWTASRWRAPPTSPCRNRRRRPPRRRPPPGPPHRRMRRRTGMLEPVEPGDAAVPRAAGGGSGRGGERRAGGGGAEGTVHPNARTRHHVGRAPSDNAPACARAAAQRRTADPHPRRLRRT